VRQQLVESLREAITSSTIAPGQVLVERELCEATGASRTSVREALRQLESEGLIETEAGRGARVATITAEKSRDIYEVRGVLEALAVRLFVERATPEQHDRLAEDLRLMVAENEPEPFLELKHRLYQTLFEGAGNEAASSLIQTLYRQISLLRRRSLAMPNRISEAKDEVRAIVAAIQRDDTRAAVEAAELHVRNAHQANLEAMASHQD